MNIFGRNADLAQHPELLQQQLATATVRVGAKAPQKSITITPDADTLAWIEAQAKAETRTLSNWLLCLVKQCAALKQITDQKPLPFHDAGAEQLR